MFYIYYTDIHYIYPHDYSILAGFIGNTTTAPRGHWDPPAGAHEFAGQAVTRLRQMLWTHLEGGRFWEDILTLPGFFGGIELDNHWIMIG